MFQGTVLFKSVDSNFSVAKIGYDYRPFSRLVYNNLATACRHGLQNAIFVEVSFKRNHR